MVYTIVPLNKLYADEMIKEWHYESSYARYDYVNEADDLLNEENWGCTRFAVLNDNTLVGELTIEFFEEVDQDTSDDGYVSPKMVMENPSTAYELWMGWGLKPSMCGQGLGRDFIETCISFAVKRYAYKGKFVFCAVLASNIRALKLYTSMGYKEFNRLEIEDEGQKKLIIQLKKKIEK